MLDAILMPRQVQGEHVYRGGGIRARVLLDHGYRFRRADLDAGVAPDAPVADHRLGLGIPIGDDGDRGTASLALPAEYASGHVIQDPSPIAGRQVGRDLWISGGERPAEQVLY